MDDYKYPPVQTGQQHRDAELQPASFRTELHREKQENQGKQVVAFIVNVFVCYCATLLD